MNLRRETGFLFVILLLVLLALTACQKAEGDPTPTPDRESAQAASTLFAQPTRQSGPTPTVTPVNEVELELSRMVADMERAVLAGDGDAYLSHVWEGAALFREEQVRWVQDWQENPLSAYAINLNGIRAEDADTATARMSITWSQQTGDLAGGATISALFCRQDGAWRFAGENWETLETDGIRLYYFADDLLDNRPQAAIVAEFLPDIYSRLTHEFDFTPEQPAAIKMYESAPTLQTMTRLSIRGLARWNQPGEAIKLTLGPSNTAPRESDVAREYAQFLIYELSGGQTSGLPWWVERGTTAYAESLFRTASARNRSIKQIAALSAAPATAERQLFAWDALQTSPNLDPSEVELAANQAYTLVHYISETYGREARNDWLRAQLDGQGVDKAAQAALGVSFAALESGWREWLTTQL
ncbi:MAG: hypothetical protein GXY36_07135 [Chloroflexi bacterium]|nr:hypothetical protein [Chloroflexota bacterium]